MPRLAWLAGAAIGREVWNGVRHPLHGFDIAEREPDDAGPLRDQAGGDDAERRRAATDKQTDAGAVDEVRHDHARRSGMPAMTMTIATGIQTKANAINSVSLAARRRRMRRSTWRVPDAMATTLTGRP